MNRSRKVLLSSFVFAAAGALVFACSSGDDTSDSGTQDAAKNDSTTKDSTATDSPFNNDSSTNDSSTNDSSTNDASDASIDVNQGDAGAATTFMVLRVGGSDDAGADAALNNASTQVFIEERNISDGSLVRTLDVPIAPSGQNQALTISGSGVSEGHLTTSTDGHYVVFAGFASAPGTASIASTPVFDGGVLRVVGRVDHSGAIDTTTQIQAFDQGDIRSAATTDGTAFWATGTTNTPDAGPGDAGDQFAGVQYALLASTGTAVNITEVPFNARVAGIFGGQLFLSSSSTPFKGVASVGTNIPTTSNQTSTLLPGMPGDAGSAYGFSLIDQDASVAGLDVLYLADDGNITTAGGGIQKWVNNGTTWSKIATFTDGTTAATGFRALTAITTNTGIIVLGTTTDNHVIKYFDDGTTLTPTGTVIATALTNTAYRGIAVGPQ